MNEIGINPFAQAGKVVKGENFWGRENELKMLKNALIHGMSTYIEGLPRMGKSSLMEQVLFVSKSELLDKNIHVLRVTLLKDYPIRKFVENICMTSIDKFLMIEYGGEKDELRMSVINSLGDPIYDGLDEAMQMVLDCLCDHKFRLVIDEFDYFHGMTTNDRYPIYYLREIISKCSNFSMITISRSALSAIVGNDNIGSTFYGVFTTSINLVGFHNHEMGKTRSRFDSIAEINDKTWNRIRNYCGNNPYLLGAMGAQITCAQNNDPLNTLYITSIFRSQHSLYERYMHQLRDVFADIDVLDSLVCLLYKLGADIPETHMNKMIAYGIITRSGTRLAFTIPMLSFYLRENVENDESIWPLFESVENGLRKLIFEVYSKEYGTNWLHSLQDKCVTEICKACEEGKARDKLFNDAKTDNDLLDFSYLNDLFKLLSHKKELFVGFITTPEWVRELEEISSRFGQLFSVRNACAHGRRHMIDETTLNSCKSDLIKIQSWSTVVSWQ